MKAEAPTSNLLIVKAIYVKILIAGENFGLKTLAINVSFFKYEGFSENQRNLEFSNKRDSN